MSFISFHSPSAESSVRNIAPTGRSLNAAFSQWILTNHGASYRAEIARQRARPHAKRFKQALSSRVAAGDGSTPESASQSVPLVGIVGGGFAGLYAGLILQSLGIEFELFERSDRVGGRIFTWYSSDYSPDDQDRSGLYGELGGMRLPQFSFDMLPVQQLALAVNSVLARNGLDDRSVMWRKFYYNSPVARLRYNNMAHFITSEEADLSSFDFDAEHGGDVPQVWFTPKSGKDGKPYLPINKVLEMVNTPFIDAINESFAEGFSMLMQYDQHSMWDYLTNVFTLGDLGDYYDPAMGPKSDFLPWCVASYLETTNVGSNMYSVSFVEMVIAVYDWGGSKDPYRPDDPSIYMLTVDGGMQRLPDACRTVLELGSGVTPTDGELAQRQVGMLPDPETRRYSYTAPNLTPDAQPPQSAAAVQGDGNSTQPPPPPKSERKRRIFLEHKVIKLEHSPQLYDGHGGMKVKIRREGDGAITEKQYPYVISTLPNGAYLNGDQHDNLLDNLSFAKMQAIRESSYMPSFKAFLTFKEQFWARLGNRYGEGLGAAATDRPNRQIIYPSYGYDAAAGVLQVYCWAQDAERLGALSDEERINECLKGIAYLYPECNSNGVNVVYDSFAGYHDGGTTKTWFWDSRSGGGAFALFAPEQFKNIYPELLTPEFGGCLNIAGEACSVHHGWIVGALDSAYNAVYHILQQAGAADKISEMKQIWGDLFAPDVEADGTANEMRYAFAYNAVDRKAASIAPGAAASIYGDSQYDFRGSVPAMVEQFDKVPQAMKATIDDKTVVQMLNAQWDENVAMRARVGTGTAPRPEPSETAVQMLERLYYGDNFQTIARPAFWLKDDDEFARQQLAGFMPNLLKKVSPEEARKIAESAGIAETGNLRLDEVQYVADYRHYLAACTVTPVAFYLAKPIVFFTVSDRNELLPLAIQLEAGGEVFTPGMDNADNAWLLAKMQTNCAGQTLHDVGFHQLLTHQISAMVSVALFSEEVFNPLTPPQSSEPFQQHPVFKLLRPHVIKTLEFQQSIYNLEYDPASPPFPASRTPTGKPGVYNLGFVYDLIFSCGRIGNYQLQDRIYHDEGRFRFLDLAAPKDLQARGVGDTPFSYAYAHDALLWYRAIEGFVGDFVDQVYGRNDAAVAADTQLQRFFGKLIPAFNHVEGSDQPAERFPAEVVTTALLKDVLTMFVWQFSVQHTVVNDGSYNQAAFVPNASTLMMPLPKAHSSKWTPADVLACLPSQTATYPDLGNMNFMDVQINASVTGQGPYSETVTGRNLVATSIDALQDTYSFADAGLRGAVDRYYQQVRSLDDRIRRRQSGDTANYLRLHPDSEAIPETVTFDRIRPAAVMNTIQT